MITATGIGNSAIAAQALDGTTPANSATSGTGSSSTASSSASISGNDFLTLLVTEMQNQDPTATTDPNEYINQLVNVNSLEQLISINQNLSTALGVSANGGAVNGSGPAAATSGTASGTVAGTPTDSTSAAKAANMSPILGGARIQHVSGNLSIPATSSAAQRVAQSLGGRIPAA